VIVIWGHCQLSEVEVWVVRGLLRVGLRRKRRRRKSWGRYRDGWVDEN